MLANNLILSAALLFFVLIYVYFVEKLNSTNRLKQCDVIMTSNVPYSGIQILLHYGTKQVHLRWSVIVVGIPVTAGGVVTLTPPATP